MTSGKLSRRRLDAPPAYRDPDRKHQALMTAVLGVAVFTITCFLPRVGLFWADFDTPQFETIGEEVLDGRLPYRDFHFEYPPLALPAIVLPAIGSPGAYVGLFKAFELVCGAVTVATVAVCGSLLGASRARLLRVVLFAALAPILLGPLVLVRFDLWATALVTGALALLLAGRFGCGGVLIGLAGAAKVFPLVLAPLSALHVRRLEDARAAVRQLAIATGALVVILVPFALATPRGAANSALGQFGRALHIESLTGSALLGLDQLGLYDATVTFSDGSYNLVGQAPDVLATVQSLVQVGFVCLILVLFARTSRSGGDLVAAAAAIVLAFAVFGKVLSPQFMLWPLPFLALAVAPFSRLARCAYVGALVLTHGFFPSRYTDLLRLEPLPVSLLIARNAVLLAAALAAIGGVARRAEPAR